MPEEIENLEDDDNVKEQEKVSSKSSPKNAASKADIVDFKKYKSRRNNKANIDSNKKSSGGNLKSPIPSKGNSAVKGLKNKAFKAG